MLTAYAKGGFGVYNADGARNNYQDISVGADARLDIQRDWNVYGGASWNRRHDEFGTPNTPAGIGLPVTVYNQFTANVGYFQTFNRLNVRLDGHADYTVADYTALSAGTSNQYDQYFTFRADVQYLPTPNVYVGPTYQFIHRTSKQFNADYD